MIHTFIQSYLNGIPLPEEYTELLIDMSFWTIFKEKKFGIFITEAENYFSLFFGSNMVKVTQKEASKRPENVFFNIQVLITLKTRVQENLQRLKMSDCDSVIGHIC